MAVYQANFKRVEMKYRLSAEQKAAIVGAMEGHMLLDRYGRTEIRSIYFDTPDYLLCRRSIEKPLYKEKLRIRSYGPVGPDGTVFVELKKKFNGVVYKRRITMERDKAFAWMGEGKRPEEMSQIQWELDFLRRRYPGLRPAVYVSYEREAYFCPGDDTLRITFDDTIRVKTDNLDLGAPSEGALLINEGESMMEIKTVGGIPLWLTKALTEQGLRKYSFSKVGEAYKMLVGARSVQDTAYRRIPVNGNETSSTEGVKQ